MPRFLQNSLISILDIIAFSIAYWLAFLFRFEFAIPARVMDTTLVNWPYVVAVHYLGLYVFGVPRMSWRYMTMRDTIRIGIAVGASSVVLVLVRSLVPIVSTHRHVFLPFGVLAMDVVLAFLALVAARAAVRLRGEL